MANVPDGSVVIDTQLDNTGFEAGSAKLDKATKDLVDTINRTGTKVKPLGDAAVKGFNTKNAVDSFVKKIDTAEQKIAEAEEKLREFGNMRFETDDFKAVLTDIEKTEAQLGKLDEKMIALQDMEVDPSSKQFLNLSRQIELTKERLQDLEIEKQMMIDNGDAYITGQDTKEYEAARQQLEAQREALNANRSIINQEAIEQARLNVLAAQERVAAAETAEERKAALQALQSAQAEYNMALQGSAGAKPVSTQATSSWQAFGQIVGNVAKKGLQVAKNLGAGVWRGITGAVKGATSAFSKLFKTHNKGNNIVDKMTKSLTSLKTMLLSRVKRMFIGEIFKTMQSGMQTLALFSDGFNQAMSNMKNGVKELALNFVTALGSGIRAVEPIVTRMLGTMTNATKYASAMIAAFAGQDTITVAKKQTENYAESLQDAADASKKLSSATLTTYDQIHKVGEETSGADTGGAKDGSDMFQKVKVSSILNSMPDFAREIYDRLKLAFATQRWSDLGRYVSYGLNLAIGKADEAFLSLQGRAQTWTAAVAEFLNGVVAGFDATKLGHTIADGLNLALGVADTFFTTFNWRNLGTKVTDGLNAIFQDYDLWALLGQTLAHGLNAAVDFVKGAADNLDWTAVGTSIGTALNSLGNTFDFYELGATISGLFTGLVETVKATAETLDWVGVGRRMNELLNGLKSEIDLLELADTINIALSGILTTISTFFENENWEADGEALAAGLIRMVRGIDAERIGHTLNVLLQSAFNALTGFIRGLNAEDFSVVESLTDFIVRVFKGIDWGEVAADLVQLLWEAIKLGFRELTSAVNIGGLLAEKLSAKMFYSSDDDEAVVNSLSETGRKGGAGFHRGIAEGLGKNPEEGLARLNVDDLIEPGNGQQVAQEMATTGQTIGRGLIEGAKTGLGKNPQDINAKFGVSDMVTASDTENLTNAMTDAGVEIGKGVKTGVEKGLGKDADWTGKEGTFTKVTNYAEEAYDPQTFKKLGENAMQGLKQGVDSKMSAVTNSFRSSMTSVKIVVETAWKDIETTITKTLESMASKSETAWKQMKTSAEGVWSGMQADASSKWQALTTTVQTYLAKLKTSIDETYEYIQSKDFYSVGQKIPESLLNGLESKWGGVSNALNNLIVDTWNNTYNTTNFTLIGEQMVNGITEGIQNKRQEMLDTLESLTGAAKDAAYKSLGIHSPSKVFAEIGGYVAQGFALGIDQQSGLSAKSVSQMAKGITAQMESLKRPTITASVDIASAEDRMLNNIENVSDRLAPLADRFAAIADAIASIGTVRVPAVVQGTYIPEQLKVSRGGSTQRIGGAADNAGIMQMLQQLISALGADEDGIGRTQRIEIPVTINGRQIGQAQAEYDRLTGRITNGGVRR